MFGLRDSDIYDIVKVLEQFPDVEEASIFGSRVMGNYKIRSDVDIALSGSNLKESSPGDISYLLNEETLMPYHFDVVDFKNLSNQDLDNHIREFGRIFYEKKRINILQDQNKKYRNKKK